MRIGQCFDDNICCGILDSIDEVVMTTQRTVDMNIA